MPVLVDGNNLLFAAHDADPERPVSRETLCRVLGQWARRARQRISVVFDGPAPRGDILQQIGDAHVEVSFSGSGITADSVLIQRIQEHSAPRRLTVISSDRAIAKAARGRRARPMRSDDFWELVQSDLARPPATALEPREKRSGLPEDAADDWLRDFGFPPETD